MVTFLRMRFQLGFRQVGDVLIGHDHAALVGLEEPHHVRQRHGLPHAAAADDGHRFAGVHVEADID